MARRSLRPHLNQIRTWVRQGRTDAWIAHQLEVTVQQIEAFRRENDLTADMPDNGDGAPAVDFDDEIDLRAEDDALIAAELEAEKAEAEAEAAAEKARAEAEAEQEDEAAARAAAAAVVAAAATARRARPASSRAPSTMARRATACGSTPPSRTTRSTPSTGRATARSR